MSGDKITKDLINLWQLPLHDDIGCRLKRQQKRVFLPFASYSHRENREKVLNVKQPETYVS